MKQVFFSITLTLFCSTSVVGQTFTVDNGQYIIPNGNTTSEFVMGTRLPDTIVGGTGHQVYRLTLSEEVTFSGLSFSGPDAAAFTSDFEIGSVTPGNRPSFDVYFSPASSGMKTAKITLNSNAPGADGTYEFAISGMGVDSLPTTQPDLSIYYNNPRIIIKPNKKTADYSIKISDGLLNEGNAPADGSIVRYYFSDDKFISADDALIAEVLVKPIPVAKPGKNGKPPKYKAAKIKVNNKAVVARNYVLKSAELLDATIMELSYSNNASYFLWD